MVTHLLGLKLTLLRNSLKRSPWQLVGLIMGGLYGLGMLILVLAGLGVLVLCRSLYSMEMVPFLVMRVFVYQPQGSGMGHGKSEIASGSAQ